MMRLVCLLTDACGTRACVVWPTLRMKTCSGGAEASPLQVEEEASKPITTAPLREEEYVRMKGPIPNIPARKE